MKEKIKKNFVIIFYVLIWLLFSGSLLLIYSGLSGYQEIKKWGLFSLSILIPFFSGYLLRKHFKFLGRKLQKIYLIIKASSLKVIIGMKKINKISLPTTILLGCIILGGFFYAIQINKQGSIERQQQIDLQAKKEADQAKTEQDKRDYMAKRKSDCLAIYKAESDKWNNVQSWSYIKPTEENGGRLMSLFHGDTCEIIYKDNKTGETFSKYY